MALAEPQEWVPRDTFAARLALVRAELGGSNMKRTAEMCGVNPESWRQWESGHKPRDYEAVCTKIANAVGCDYRWLMVGGPLSSIRWICDAPCLSSVFTEGQLEIPYPIERDLALVGS